MKEILNFLNTHWSDFIIETFAVFMGFISAFVLQIWLDHSKNRSTKKNILSGIKNELSKTITILEALEDDDFGLDLYNKPYWDSIVSTGQVELLIQESYYQELVLIYHRITTANSWEGLHSQACLVNGRVNPAINKRVSDTRKQLIKDISEVLLLLPK